MNAKKKMGIKTGDTVVVITGKQAPATVDGRSTTPPARSPRLSRRPAA